jgi:hypothetical protein
LRRVEGWQILVGRGFANQDLIDRGVVDAATAAYLRSGFNDNVFLLESYNHGILAGLVYLVLIGAALVRGVVASRRPGPGQTLAAGLTASLATAFVLHFFDNYFSESVFMKAGLWLLIGVLMGCVASRSDRDSEDQVSAEYKRA